MKIKLALSTIALSMAFLSANASAGLVEISNGIMDTETNMVWAKESMTKDLSYRDATYYSGFVDGPYVWKVATTEDIQTLFSSSDPSSTLGLLGVNDGSYKGFVNNNGMVSIAEFSESSAVVISSYVASMTASYADTSTFLYRIFGDNLSAVTNLENEIRQDYQDELEYVKQAQANLDALDPQIATLHSELTSAESQYQTALSMLEPAKESMTNAMMELDIATSVLNELKSGTYAGNLTENDILVNFDNANFNLEMALSDYQMVMIDLDDSENSIAIATAGLDKTTNEKMMLEMMIADLELEAEMMQKERLEYNAELFNTHYSEYTSDVAIINAYTESQSNLTADVNAPLLGILSLGMFAGAGALRRKKQ